MIKEDERDRMAAIVEWAKFLPEVDRGKALWLIGVAARDDHRNRRTPLPDTREAFTHKFTIHSLEFGNRDYFLTVGLYEDGRPGEIFFKMGLQSDNIAIMLDQWAIGVSMLLQYGVGIDHICSKWSDVNCEPAGPVESGDETFRIFYCKSPFDYVARFLRHRFGALDV